MPPPEQEQQLQPSVSSALWKNLLHPACALSRMKNGFAQMGAICCLKKKKNFWLHYCFAMYLLISREQYSGASNVIGFTRAIHYSSVTPS